MGGMNKQMGFRPTPALRRKLEEAARRNGRSLAKEIEVQLEVQVAAEAAIERWETVVRRLFWALLDSTVADLRRR